MAVSLDSFLTGGGETFLQPGYTLRPRPTDGTLLDWQRDGFLHVLNHAGVLLDADLPRDRVVDGLGAGNRRFTHSPWDSHLAGHFRLALCRACCRAGNGMANSCVG